MMGSLTCEPSKLYQSLKLLHIETGKLGNNEISAWHDTFNQTQQKFLEWFENSVSTDNCESYSESEAHQELLEKKLFIEGPDYKDVLTEFKTVYPGLFNYDENEYDCELLTTECEYYEEELKYLEQALTRASDCNKRTRYQQNSTRNELNHAEFSKDNTALKCLEVAADFDQLNTELQEKFLTCCNHMSLQEDNIRFLCEIDLTENNCLLLHKLESIDRFFGELHKHENLDCSFNSTMSDTLLEGSFAVSDWEKTIYTDPVYDKAFDNMTMQLVKTLNDQTLNIAWSRVYNLQLKWLQQQSKIGLLIQKHNIPEQFQIMLNQKEEEICTSNNRTVKHLIAQPMLMHDEEHAGLELINQILTKIELKLDSVLQYQIIIQDFLQIEMSNFDMFDTFMNNVHSYINEFQFCEDRTEAMRYITSNYNTYVSKPIEEKWRLLPVILKIIGAEPNLSLEDALQAIQIFEDKCDALEYKIFIGDIAAMGTELKKLNENNKIMVNFLSHKATDTINVIPNEIYYALKNSIDSVTEYNKFIKHSQSIPKEMISKFENNKWLKLKRQLWMYFLRKPTKLESIISEIEEFVRKKRAAYLNSEI